MNALGKLADVLIFIVVLFIFPVTWALLESKNASVMGTYRTADEFISKIEREEEISFDSLKWLEERLKNIQGIKFGLYVLRDSYGTLMTENGKTDVEYSRQVIVYDEIMQEIYENGHFILMPRDTVFLEIQDRFSVLYTSLKSSKTG